jgi:hypothetical protein
MSKEQVSTRRYFLKAGAVLSAPVAVSVATLANDTSRGRLAQLEDERAICALHQDWLQEFNAVEGTAQQSVALHIGGKTAGDKVRKIVVHQTAQDAQIAIVADGKRATGRFHCAVELERAIAPTCTLAQMAHLQGGGFVRRTERRDLLVDYAKADGGWSIARIRLAPADI